MRCPNALLVGILIVTASALPARATTITLSDFSSNSHISASQLDATLDFQIVNGQLQLTVTNTSSDFRINRIMFNATSNIEGLSLVSPTSEWHLSPRSPRVPGSGRFDFQLLAQHRGSPGQLEPGQSQTFILNISGSNVDVSNFTTQATAGANSAIAGAQFINIAGANSNGGAFGLRLANGNQTGAPPPSGGGAGQEPPPGNGGAVPLPAPLSMGLVLLGSAGLMRRRLRL